MASIGIASDHYYAFKKLKENKAYRYVISKIDIGRNEVVVEKTGGRDESHDDFLKSLPRNDCRYVVYDFGDGQDSKLFFVVWSPKASNMFSKMACAQSKDWYRSELDGIHYEMEATDISGSCS